MLVPGAEAPEMPAFVRHDTRVGRNLVTTIDEDDAVHGIGWAEELIGLEVAEEYALGATTLEDVYIRLTGHASSDDETG